MGAVPSSVTTGGATTGGVSTCCWTWVGVGGAFTGARSSSIGGGGFSGGGGSWNRIAMGVDGTVDVTICATIGRMTAMSAAALRAMAALMATMRTVSG